MDPLEAEGGGAACPPPPAGGFPFPEGGGVACPPPPVDGPPFPVGGGDAGGGVDVTELVVASAGEELTGEKDWPDLQPAAQTRLDASKSVFTNAGANFWNLFHKSPK